MKRTIIHAGSALLGIGLLLLCRPEGHAADEQADDVQVQQEGPIHEAYAAPRSVSNQPPQQVNQQPPPDIKEDMPDEMPDENSSQWIPGYWDSNGQNQFTWVSGCWRAPPPGQQWVNGYWQQDGKAWRRRPGFWTQCSTGNDDETAEQDISYYPQPPEPQDEDPGEDPDGESDWCPGSWTYSADQPGGFVWTPGLWVRRRPGWLWNGASWTWTSAGYVWNRGYWDWSYGRRGWAYAPVRIPRGLWNRPGWVYRPTRVISPLSLNRRSLAVVNNRFRLRGATIAPINRLTGVRHVPVTAAKRRRLQNQTNKFRSTAIVRKKVEGNKRHPGKGIVHHKVNIPRPRPTKNPTRLNVPSRPSRTVAKKPGTGGVRRPGTGGVRRPPSRTTAVKKPGTGGVKKPPARTTVAKKPPVRKTTGTRKPSTARKPVRKTSSRPVAKKPPAKKSGGARKSTARKPAPRRAAPKRTAARKPSSHRSAPRRSGGARRSGGGGGGRRR
jgi:hypothetical protein